MANLQVIVVGDVREIASPPDPPSGGGRQPGAFAGHSEDLVEVWMVLVGLISVTWPQCRGKEHTCRGGRENQWIQHPS